MHESEIASVQKLRSSVNTFLFHTDFFLREKYVDKLKAIKCPSCHDYQFSQAMFLHVKHTIKEQCAIRCEQQMDEWVEAVSCILACTNDLPAEEAIYHRRLFQYFMSPRHLNLDAVNNTTDGSLPKKRGRSSGSEDEVKKLKFMQVIEYLENNDDDTITLDELHELMTNQANSDEVYTKRSPKGNCMHIMVTASPSHHQSSSHSLLP